MRTNYATQAAEPTVFVTKGRQRVKQHNRNIYLRDGDEFELELFNPTQYKILAKINLNGTFLGSGLVLRPGERIFLERFLSESKKFMFETYDVGTDKVSQKAIELNGKVEVDFYKEMLSMQAIFAATTSHTGYYTTFHGTQWPNTVLSDPQEPYYYTATPLLGTNLCYNMSSAPQCSAPLTQETGRIEMGSNSNQNFCNTTESFEPSCFARSIWQILPESQKTLTREDLKVYCVNCGAKRKKESFKFCPSCGTKF